MIGRSVIPVFDTFLWFSPADRATLIRRITYDLHGLPPAPEQIDVFISDSGPCLSSSSKVLKK